MNYSVKPKKKNILQGDRIEHPDYVKEHNLKINYKLSDYNIRISPKSFLRHMRFDKKVKNKKIKLILIKDIGSPIRLFLENEKLLSNFLKNELK